MKIALCYYGPPRCLRRVYKNHEKYLRRPSQSYHVEYEAFVHTWVFKGPQLVRDKVTTSEPDYAAWNLINPSRIVTDDQDEFLESIDMSQYFYQDIWERYGHRRTEPGDMKGEWYPQLVTNYLCALESQKRVMNLVEDTYDYVGFIRPDIAFTSFIDIDSVLELKGREVIIPDWGHFEGYNDKFIALPRSAAKVYSMRIDDIAEFRKNCGRIVAEKYTKYYLDKNNFTVLPSKDIQFRVLREEERKPPFWQLIMKRLLNHRKG